MRWRLAGGNWVAETPIDATMLTLAIVCATMKVVDAEDKAASAYNNAHPRHFLRLRYADEATGRMSRLVTC